VDVSQAADGLPHHSLVLLHKTLVNKAPQYMFDKVTAGGNFAYTTRKAAFCPEGFGFSVQHPTDSGTIRQMLGNKLWISKLGWCWRSEELYNRLPTSIRLENKLPNFKKMLKIWIELNISI
jgi:hypothetical protein